MQVIVVLRIIIKLVLYASYAIARIKQRMNGGIDEAEFNKKRKDYEELRLMLNTGDIILFSGRGFVSWAIRYLTKSKWSHVGMVIKLDDSDMVLLFESTTLSKTRDILTGKMGSGVQLVSLGERLAQYDGEAGVVFLRCERSAKMLKALCDFRAEVKGRPYEQNNIQLFKSMYDGCFGRNKKDLSSLFCSELVAEAYQRMGVLSDNAPSDEYTPANFDSEHKLPFINGCSLSPVVPILNRRGV